MPAERGFGRDTGEWPFAGLDVAALRGKGWVPTPFRQFVLKTHSRCNLNCDYCYMYRMSDQSWSSTPLVMSRRVLAATASRIGEHARYHGLPKVDVVLHGGEPLLAGAEALADIAVTVRAALPSHTELDLHVQTNGTLLDTTMLDVFARHGIHVGLSVDGDRETHDRHRGHAGGRGSFTAITDALELLRRPDYHQLYSGLLCVVDVTSDPVRTYESLLAFAPPTINFLLPHGNWSIPPPLLYEHRSDAPYGAWLVAAFDRWYRVAEQETEVRIFAEIINLVLGGDSRSESIGLSPVALVTVNTDGAMEQVDTLRSAYEGAVATGRNVLDHDFDELLSHPGFVARQIGTTALADTCLRCDLHRICGGGHYAHRYRRGHGFRNPSVYCRDLTMLIRHVLRRVNEGMATVLTPDTSAAQVSGGSMSQSAR